MIGSRAQTPGTTPGTTPEATPEATLATGWALSGLSRRAALRTGAGVALTLMVRDGAATGVVDDAAQGASDGIVQLFSRGGSNSVFGAPGTPMRDAIDRFANGATPRPGPLRLEVPELVDNGNLVPFEVALEAPAGGTARVTGVAVFTQKNPQPGVAVFHFGMGQSRVRVATRMRLADSQRIVALARFSDDTVWFVAADVVVALAACLE